MLTLRRWIVTLIALGAVAAFSTPATAAVTGTAHDVVADSACEKCHIPHGGATATRLWPIPAVTPGQAPSISLVGVVSPLCGTCHINGVGYAYTFNHDTSVYGQLSHGVQMTVNQIPGGSNLGTSGMPYTGDSAYTLPTGGLMECTSCHDVHNNPAATKPFLRYSLDTLCQRCHTNRNFQDGVVVNNTFGPWGTGNTQVGVNNPGSHPVGTDISGNNKGGSSPISFHARFQNNTNPADGAWLMGGHLFGADNNQVGCPSCHAVHGVQMTEPSSAPEQVPTVNMLVFDPAGANGNGNGYVSLNWVGGSPGGDLSGYNVANGDGGYNELCEGCHRGPAPTTQEPGYGTSYFPNPGGSLASHPVDDLNSTRNMSVTAFPTYWAVGDNVLWNASAALNSLPIPICESCHVAHPAAALSTATDRPDVRANAGDYILRDSATAICTNCHTSTFAGHHPVTASGGVAGVTYLQTGGNLSCGTCHQGSGSAHNWAGAGGGGLALQSAWRPDNNLRHLPMTGTPNQRFSGGDGSAGSYYLSTTCVDCHLGLSTSTNPSIRAAASGQNQLHGEGTHMIGATTSAFLNNSNTLYDTTTWAWTGNVTFNPTTDNWVTAAGVTGQGYSRFAASSGSPILVCESCHELEPGRNNTNARLTLFPYAEGVLRDQEASNFCMGCHGIPSNTHPMSGQTVSRTGAALNISGAGSWVKGSITPGVGPTWDSPSDSMSCDSCHQTHDAPTNSASLIIDSDQAIPVHGNGNDNVFITGMNGGNPVAYRANKARGNISPHETFCQQCHGY